MNGVIVGLLAETALHPGAGQNLGAIDLPVAREAVTQYPVMVGSSMKGALLDAAKGQPFQEAVFGKPDSAGGVAVSDARLLLLPVRSLTGHFKWVTCPYVLERLQRDAQLVGKSLSFSVPAVGRGKALVAAGAGRLYLEELVFDVEVSPAVVAVAAAIKPFLRHVSVQNRLHAHLVIVSDDEFRHFATSSLPVNAHNQLDDTTKESKSLWYEEALPPDTVLYTLLIPRVGHEANLKQLIDFLNTRTYIQLGGNETVGQGWCAMSVQEV